MLTHTEPAWFCCEILFKYTPPAQFLKTSVLWCGVVKGQDTGSGVNKVETTAGSNQFLLVQPQTVFSTHTKSSRSRIDKRTARATGNTRYRYSKNGPLDHKMADNCVSLARTNTLSSTITKLIKTSKTSNENLVDIGQKKMEGILLRSRARWAGEEEKITKYFCGLEKKKLC